MVMVYPEMLNNVLMSLSCLFNELSYSFDSIGIRIKFCHVFFYFLILLLDVEFIKFSLVLFIRLFFLLSCVGVIFSPVLVT